MKILHILLLTSIVILAGCASATSKMNRLSVGMTKKEVIAAMGDPASTAAPGNGVEILRYDLSSTFTTVYLANHGIASAPQDYFVKLIDGKVDSYGMVGDFNSTKDPTINVNIQNR